MTLQAAIIAHVLLTGGTGGSNPLEIMDADNQLIYDADGAVILSEP